MAVAFRPDEKDRIVRVLVETAERLFATQGLKKTSLDELVQPAGIAKGSFYAFFDSKESLSSGCFSDDAVNVGANARHGPHHDAQKSTSTMSLSLMMPLNSAAVMSLVLTLLPTLRCTCLFPVSGQLNRASALAAS